MFFRNLFSWKKNHIDKGSTYGILRGDYKGEIFVFFEQKEHTLYFVTLPKMELRKVDIVKFDIGINEKILDFINILPYDVYKVVESHGKNIMSTK
jgi:hypothetical protein